MGKKCIPGLICIENMTLFMLIILFIIVVYIYYTTVVNHKDRVIVVQTQPQPSTINTLVETRYASDPLVDLYSPPLRKDGLVYNNGLSPRVGGGLVPVPTQDVRGGVPVNIQTRGVNTSYEQKGILTRTGGGNMILPLMGRRLMSGRDKWQYYTMTSTGNLNTKLPVSVNGKSCSGEYGCDEIMNGDSVYVEGYGDTFRATVYENGLFSYIPFL